MEYQKKMGLLKSLVGSTMEFRFSDKEKSVTYLKTISTERKVIEKDVSVAHKVGGSTCLKILAEMLDYYRRQSYYMAVRSALIMKRHRPSVLDYLNTQSIDERSERLVNDLKKTGGRYEALIAIKYFLRSFPNRVKYFRPYMTKEEILFTL